MSDQPLQPAADVAAAGWEAWRVRPDDPIGFDGDQVGP